MQPNTYQGKLALSVTIFLAVPFVSFAQNFAATKQTGKRTAAEITVAAKPTYVSGSSATTISKRFLTGRFEPSRDTSFVKVSHQYTDRLVYLKKETYQAYIRMYQAALKQGITLNIISGTRSFYDQHNKWESKWYAGQFAGIKDQTAKGNQLLRWWSMPGTSRHHWGTDMDLTNLQPAFYKAGQGKKMYDWMLQNAASYGFYQPFNAGRTTGYQEEKWHWSYVPLSKIYLQQYLKQVTYADINGFPGSPAAKELDVINTRVLAINPDCK